MSQRVAAADDEQLKRVIDASGVRLARPDQWHHLTEIGIQELRGHRLPACGHPIDVAAHGVDLAVVAQKPVGMREPPRREGVGRKPLMDEGEPRPSAGCADPRRSSRSGAPAAGPCRQEYGSRTTAYKDRAMPAARAARPIPQPYLGLACGW